MDYKEIKKLMDDVGASKIDEIKIEFPDGTKIEMKKNNKETVRTSAVNNNIATEGIAQLPQQVNKVIVNNETPVSEVKEDNFKTIKSPMVGTFYSKPAPNADCFVKVGDHVKKGQIVCIVEAMKLMNEIESEFDGEVVEICCKDEDMVEYGSPLIKIK